MPIKKDIFGNIFEGSIKRVKKALNNPYKKANLTWFDVKILKHRPNGELHNHKLLGKKTFFINSAEYLHALDEIFIEEVYLQTLPDNAFVIDCGSHIGISIIYLKKLSVNATIIAFEPDKNNFELLQKNIESHNLKNIILKNEAVWKADEFLNFNSDSNMGSKLVPNNNEPHSNLVKATRLKNLINKKVDFLKIDIEGAEYEVLIDIKDNLHFVEKLFIEYHGSYMQNNELLEIFEIINKQGFSFYIKEATSVSDTPFYKKNNHEPAYDLQLNIFCFRS